MWNKVDIYGTFDDMLFLYLSYVARFKQLRWIACDWLVLHRDVIIWRVGVTNIIMFIFVDIMMIPENHTPFDLKSFAEIYFNSLKPSDAYMRQ